MVAIAYLIPFVLLGVLLIASLVESDLLITILFLQLIWAPIAILHTIIQFFRKHKFPTPIPKHLNIIFGVFLAYVMIIISLASSDGFWDVFESGGVVFITVFSIIPWSMLLHFAYIQFLIMKHGPEENQDDEGLLDIDLE